MLVGVPTASSTTSIVICSHSGDRRGGFCVVHFVLVAGGQFEVESTPVLPDLAVPAAVPDPDPDAASAPDSGGSGPVRERPKLPFPGGARVGP